MVIPTAVEKLKRDLMIMGEMCENAVSTAIMAMVDRDEELAKQAVAYDQEIDEMELAVDQDCLALMALELSDEYLRFCAAAMKISRDLERIGDHATEICEHVLFLVSQKTVLPQVIDFASLVEQVGQMMRESIRALVEHDVKLAWKLIDEHLVIHEEMQLIFAEVLEVMHDSPATIERCCHILAVARALERVGDLCTNVAEEVVYLTAGEVVRHHIREHHPLTPALVTAGAEPDDQAAHETEVLKRHTRRLEKKGQRKPGTRRS